MPSIDTSRAHRYGLVLVVASTLAVVGCRQATGETAKGADGSGTPVDVFRTVDSTSPPQTGGARLHMVAPPEAAGIWPAPSASKLRIHGLTQDKKLLLLEF